MPKFSNRSQDVPNSGISVMMRYGSKYPDCISLGQGTPLFPTPDFIYDYVREKARTDSSVGQYALPKLERELTALIAEDVEKWYGYKPKLEEIALGVGAISGLFSAMMAFINPGDEVIYFDPSYPLHLSQLHLVGAVTKFVALDEERGWRPDLKKLAETISDKTKMIILTNPNNPTGTVWTESEIEELVKIVKEHDVILVLDEAYRFLDYTSQMKSPFEYDEIRDKTILIKSFSKEFAMTGWRLGYFVGPEDIIRHMRTNIETYFMVEPPTISIHAAIAAMSDKRGEEFMNYLKGEFLNSREAICSRLERMPKLFQFTKPDGAFYVFAKILPFPELNSMQFCQKLVDEARVIMIPGDSSGPAGARHARMSFAASSDLINRAFDNLDEFVKKNGLA